MGPQELVDTVVGLAKLGYTDAALYNAILDASYGQLTDFKPAGLSGFVWALATAGHPPPAPWLACVYDEVRQQLPLFCSRDIADLLWGLCRADLRPNDYLLADLVEAALYEMQEEDGGQDAASILSCIARWCYRCPDYQLPDGWTDQFLELTNSHLATYLPQHLVSIVHSLVCLNVQPNDSWMARLYGAVKDRLMFDPALEYSDFSRLLWALSRIEYSPPTSWLRDFVEVSIPALSHLKSRALSELAWALACWDFKPSRAWLDAYLASSAQHMAEYRPQQLAMTLAALSRLNCRAPVDWLNLVLSQFCAHLSEAKVNDLVALIEALPCVCDDKAWLARQSSTIGLIADAAASKFVLCDALTLAKMAIALARCNCYPGQAWLKQQQDSLALVGGSGQLEEALVADLQVAYREMAERQHS